MELLYMHEHLACFDYDHSQRPQIEMLAFRMGQQQDVFIDANEIIFFMKGTIRQVFRDYPMFENSEGEFVFLPCNGKVSLSAISDSTVIVFRLDKHIRFCENYFLENLYLPQHLILQQQEEAPCIKKLLMNERISNFIAALNDCISDGLRCRHFFELKVKEFFLLLRAYYTKEQLRDLFRLVLSPDTTFSEYIRKNRNKYPTVKQMAASMNLSTVHFSAKFKKIFGQTAYRWMKQSKVRHIRREIIFGAKPLKLIAEENGFSTMAQFSNFCKKELGTVPSRIRKEVMGLIEPHTHQH